MSQVTDMTVPGSPLTMATLASALEAIFAALGSQNRGATAPSNPYEGMLWWDSSGSPTEILKRYAVAAGWVNILSLNTTTGAMIPYRSGTALGTMSTATATDYVAKALFDANTILAANSDDTPAAVTVAEQRIVGRATGGNIDDLTPAQVIAMLSADGTWPSAGKIVQVVNYKTSSAASGTTVIPMDDSIPQNTEGDEIMTLAITPKSAANYLFILVTLHFVLGQTYHVVAALFQDSTANALAAASQRISAADTVHRLSFSHYMQAGTTLETTFKVRIGPNVSATWRLNGEAAKRHFGGVAVSSITIFEIGA